MTACRRYTDGPATHDGIKSIVLVAGEDERASITVKGKGTALRGPALPVTPPLRVQLVAGNGECWETVFGVEDVDVNTAADLKAVDP